MGGAMSLCDPALKDETLEQLEFALDACEDVGRRHLLHARHVAGAGRASSRFVGSVYGHHTRGLRAVGGAWHPLCAGGRPALFRAHAGAGRAADGTGRSSKLLAEL